MRLPAPTLPALRRGRILLPLILLAAPLGAAPDADPLAPSEKAASEWIKVRLETARLESQWLAEKPLLQSLVGSMKDRAQALEERRDLLTAKTAKDREELAALKAKDQATADDLRTAEGQLQALSTKLRELRPFLPPRLSEALELSYKSLGNGNQSVGERMQLVMTMLNRCLEFNRTITAGEEVLAIGGGGAKSFEVIYWGLGYGYALDREARSAWYGAPGPQGWQWEAKPEAAPAVAKAIAVNTDKADPDFVALPAMLHGQPEEAR